MEWGLEWVMTIEEGPTGPLFRVTNAANGQSFVGDTPTRPWTDVCHSRRSGQRGGGKGGRSGEGLGG